MEKPKVDEITVPAVFRKENMPSGQKEVWNWFRTPEAQPGPQPTRTPETAASLASMGSPKLRKQRKETLPMTTQTAGTTSSSHSGSSWDFSPKVTKMLWISFGIVALVITNVFFYYKDKEDHAFANTEGGKSQERTRQMWIERNHETAKTSTSEERSSVPGEEYMKGQLAPSGTLYASDGDQFIIPENARTIVPAGATIVIVNTAWRIKSFSGDFTVQQLGSSESASPANADYFASVPKWPAQTKVRIHVNSGVVQLNT